jgi:hypothetical protein
LCEFEDILIGGNANCAGKSCGGSNTVHCLPAMKNNTVCDSVCFNLENDWDVDDCKVDVTATPVVY